jgi:exodeoxyribonuclease VII small subunit
MSKKTFKDAYGVLQRHSEALRNQREPNIDDLLTIVTESVEAYKPCTSGIDAVEQALEQALGGAGIAASSAGGPEPASLCSPAEPPESVSASSGISSIPLELANVGRALQPTRRVVHSRTVSAANFQQNPKEAKLIWR